MTPLSIVVLSFSMSADAFAAALARGAVERPGLSRSVYFGMVFGTIEAITPLLGWAAGFVASQYIESIDHWVAFSLLGGVGAHMIFAAVQDGEDPGRDLRVTSIWSMIATAIGTSIDAAAVGVSLALVEANIVVIAACIGLATFVMSTAGLLAGRYFGARLGSVVEMIAGVALIGLGTKILLDHLGYLG